MFVSPGSRPQRKRIAASSGGGSGIGGIASLASAATVDLGSVTATDINITGVVTITSFGSSAASGAVKWVKFSGSLTLTNSASLVLPGGQNIQTAAGDTLLTIYQGSGNWIVWGYSQSAGFRIKLSVDTTFFVRTDGNDANSGLVNSAAGAWLTTQRAMNVLAGLYDFNAKNITVQVIAGTYTAGASILPWTGGGTLTIIGDNTTPANVVISTTGADCFGVNAGALPGALSIKGFKLTTATSGNCFSATVPGSITLGNMEYGACAGSHVFATGPCTVYLPTNYKISGGAVDHWQVQSGANVSNLVTAMTVTLTGTPNFSGQFAYAANCANIIAGLITFSGSATGIRYSVNLNGVIQTVGGGANYFPGNVAGSAATGGQYV